MRQEERDNGVDERIGRILAEAAGMQKTEGPCPSPEQIASLMDGGLGMAERERVISHVASCDTCREVLTTAAMLADRPAEEPAVARWSFASLIPYAAAAAIAVAALSTALVYRHQAARSLPATEAVVAKADAVRQAEPATEQAESLNELAEPVTVQPEPAPETMSEVSSAAVQKKAEAAPGGDKAPVLAMTDMPSVSGGTRSFRADKDMVGYADERKESAPPAGEAKPAPENMMFAQAPRRLPPAPAKLPQEGLKKQEAAAPAKEPVCKPAADGRGAICVLPEDENETAEAARGAASAGAPAPQTFAKAGAAQVQAESAAVEDRFSASGFGAQSAPAASAEPTLEKASGTILSIDHDKLELVIAITGTDKKVTLKADAKLIEGLKPGNRVKAVYEKGAVNVAKIISKERAIVIPAGC